MSDNTLTDWIGRTELRTDTVRADALRRLAATLDHDPSALHHGDAAMPLAHWIHFLPEERQSDLGPDGHAKRGGFLPPIHHLPRRMWAGSRLTFPGTMRAGMAVERRSTIADIKEKQGSTGPLVFVTVKHEVGEAGGGPLLVEEQDIVYRGLDGAPSGQSSAPPAPKGEWHRSLMADAVLLFRYSALTFNGHRIHYDYEYVTQEEGYPGLVVHGPLIATLLLDLVGRMVPEAGVAAYSFRAVSPVFGGSELHLNGTPPDGDGKVALWASDKDGRLAMKAEAQVSL